MKKLTMALCVLVLAGCDEKKEAAAAPVAAPPAAPTAAAPKAPEAAAPAEAPKPAAGALAWKNLDPLPVKAELPADVELMDASADAPGVSVFNNGSFNVNVNEVTAVYATDLKGAKKELELDPNKVKKITKEEKTKDGWVLEWEAESMMDKKPLYGVQVRKMINKKGYQCARNVDDKAVADQISKACQTLAAK